MRFMWMYKRAHALQQAEVPLLNSALEISVLTEPLLLQKIYQSTAPSERSTAKTQRASPGCFALGFNHSLQQVCHCLSRRAHTANGMQVAIVLEHLMGFI